MLWVGEGAKILLYKSLVRTHLEFCSPAWNPYLVKDKKLLGKVQPRFTRMFPELKRLSHEERLRKRQLWTSEPIWLRLLDGQRIFSDSMDSVLLSCWRYNSGHNWKLYKQHSRCDVRLHFFTQRSINGLYGLTQEEIDATSINSFKKNLEKQRKCQMDFFMDWLVCKSYGCTTMDGDYWVIILLIFAKCKCTGELVWL